MNWHLFTSIFILIFVAELPDKTAFATLLLAARSRPLPVFVGVATAFLVQTVVAILAGSLFALFPAVWVHLASGFMFFFFAFQMWRSRHETEGDMQNAAEHEIAVVGVNFKSLWSSCFDAFLVVFIAEWGDLTQLATASLAARYPSEKITVFMASLFALWTVTAFAVVLGRSAQRFIDPPAIKRYAAIVFALIGTYFVLTAVRGLL